MGKGDKPRVPWSKKYQSNYDKIFKNKERCTHEYTKQGCCDICGKDLIGE